MHYLTTETVGYRKPHPKIFEDMIDQLGVKPSEIMYVGDDALNDVAPARAMGMEVYKQEDAELAINRRSRLYNYYHRGIA